MFLKCSNYKWSAVVVNLWIGDSNQDAIPCFCFIVFGKRGPGLNIFSPKFRPLSRIGKYNIDEVLLFTLIYYCRGLWERKEETHFPLTCNGNQKSSCDLHCWCSTSSLLYFINRKALHPFQEIIIGNYLIN